MFDTALPEARIGPNAILQYLPVIDRAGPVLSNRILAEAGVTSLPDGSEMIPETDAARLHQAVRRLVPDHAPKWAAEAGARTADYILANRIPKPAQWLLRFMPAMLAAPMLSKAIARNAWTFAGSGQFERASAWTFRIHNNPIVRFEASNVPLCHWHAAVFERLFRSLVAPDCVCRETTCCAQPGQAACAFVVSRGQS